MSRDRVPAAPTAARAPRPGGRGVALTPPPYGVAAVDQPVVQRKLLRWDNPHVTSLAAADIPKAKKDIDAAAVTIDDAVEDGAREVRQVVVDFKGGKTPDKIKKSLNTHGISKAHVRNFVNKLIDWGTMPTGKTQAIAIRSAGYIIEEFANKAANAKGIETQVAIDGSRPDFRQQTAYTYVQGGQTHAAHGLIDATSQAEAAHGHILDKVNRMSPANALDHPILYDSYYTDLGFGGGPSKNVKLTGPAVKARAKYYKMKADQAKARKASLRGAKKIKKKKSGSV